MLMISSAPHACGVQMLVYSFAAYSQSTCKVLKGDSKHSRQEYQVRSPVSAPMPNAAPWSSTDACRTRCFGSARFASASAGRQFPSARCRSSSPAPHILDAGLRVCLGCLTLKRVTIELHSLVFPEALLLRILIQPLLGPGWKRAGISCGCQQVRACKEPNKAHQN